MELGKLGKKLRKEFVRSPKKSAALGLMCLVALYFWAPLVVKFFGGGSDDDAPEDLAMDNSPVAVVVTSATSEPSSLAADLQPAFEWRELRGWITGDPDMTSATFPSGQRDPFSAGAVSMRLAADVDDESENLQDATPQSLGLELGGTIVGSNSRVAMINGRPYREDTYIKMPGESESSTSQAQRFRIKTIEADRVILARNDREYTLLLKRGPTDDLVIRRAP